nr:zinc finger MYM-type protein 1-like [Setaria viridis]XP_034572201.1 zinc finger MYM-type protein 1-like [Setaria viridis]
MSSANRSRKYDILAQKGPTRDLSITKGPKDRYSRRFSALFYTRILSNGEHCDRDWLVYSKELVKVFWFGCKLFTKGHRKGQLANEGFNDWIHLGIRLKEHETSPNHVLSMTTWYELRSRLQKDQTIDKDAQRQLEKEKDHWRKVLFRIVCIDKFLAKHNLAFRGTNSKMYEDSNGNFLGLVEMLAEFDPIIQEHVRRITSEETQAHYLDFKIQNELIHLLASAIKSEIIKKIKSAKYFSVILDCTPDASHQEQMSLIIRYVDSSSSDVRVEESFIGFLDVNDTTGQGIFDVLENELKLLGLDIDDVRGQGYDNGSNMKGKHKGVKKKLLDVNPRAFYSACGCHSLNLTLCDMAKTCGKAKDFFGIIQRIYTTFANSTKKWQILKDNISGLTLKSVSATRWESRVESVKAIRFQCTDIREALLQVSDVDNDPKTSSEAKGLANNELGEYEFILSIVIWYEVLYVVNLVSKHLQAKDMLIDVAIEKVEGLISFFKGYRETGFSEALEIAKGIALEMDIGTTFRKRREIKRKKQFDENLDDTNATTQSAEELFRISYFLPVVDQAISSLTTRFEQYQSYQQNFGFLFTSETLQSLDDTSLKSSCDNLGAVLTKDGKSDVDANDLYVELKFLQHFIPKENMGSVEILKFLKRHDYFPNASIAYRILLTIPVTVASAERSFSKLKLLKSYLRSTMTQQRLNDLATIALESGLLEKIDYEHIIEDFISRNTKRMKYFN